MARIKVVLGERSRAGLVDESLLDAIKTSGVRMEELH